MNRLVFLLCAVFFFSTHGWVQAAVSAVSFKTTSASTAPKLPKILLKKAKKTPRSNFAGLEAYGYIAMFFLVMILVGVGLILSLVFKWTVAAWIFGSIFGLQLLICLFFLVSLLLF